MILSLYTLVYARAELKSTFLIGFLIRTDQIRPGRIGFSLQYDVGLTKARISM